MKSPSNALAEHCDSSVHHMAHVMIDSSFYLPRAPLAGITAFTLLVCCHCSNSAQSALSAGQGHTQPPKLEIPFLMDQTDSTSCTDKTPALHQLPWGIMQAANVMTAAEVKSFCTKRCSLSIFFPHW